MVIIVEVLPLSSVAKPETLFTPRLRTFKILNYPFVQKLHSIYKQSSELIIIIIFYK